MRRISTRPDSYRETNLLNIRNIITRLGHPFAMSLTAHAPRILMYHRFSQQPEWRRLPISVFEQQLLYLKSHFSIISLADLVRTIREKRTPPRNAVVITIDDGYLDFLQLAAPVLAKYRVPATVFVISDFADQKIWLWYDALNYLTMNAPADTRKLVLNRKTFKFRLRGVEDRQRLWTRLADHVLYETCTSKAQLINDCQEQFHIELPGRPTDTYRAMTWDELNSLDPQIDLGSHTCTHPILSTVQDPAVLAHEIGDSRLLIERKTGRAVTAFCYPNGMPRDYNEITIREVKRSGYECAVTAHGGFVNPGQNNLYHLPRLPGPSGRSQFIRTLSGMTHIKKQIPYFRT